MDKQQDTLNLLPKDLRAEVFRVGGTLSKDRRLVCREEREGTDRALTRLRLADSCGPGAFTSGQDAEQGRTIFINELEAYVRGKAERGCQPKTVELLLRNGQPEALQQCSLQVISALHGAGAETSSLTVLGPQLSLPVANTITTVFPGLRKLSLKDLGAQYLNGESLAAALQRLFGVAGGGSGAGDSQEGAAATAAPLPHLTSLHLEDCSSGQPQQQDPLWRSLGGLAGLRDLTWLGASGASVAHISALTQLTSLKLGLGDGPYPTFGSQLARLTQLRSLDLSYPEGLSLEPALPALTLLTRLRVHMEGGGIISCISADPLTRLTALKELSTPNTLSFDGPASTLEGLSSLTYLEAESICHEDTLRWRRLALPLQLERLTFTGLTDHDLASLGALQVPSTLTRLSLPPPTAADPLRCYMSDVYTAADGPLLPEGEANMCDAFRLLALANPPVKEFELEVYCVSTPSGPSQWWRPQPRRLAVRPRGPGAAGGATPERLPPHLRGPGGHGPPPHGPQDPEVRGLRGAGRCEGPAASRHAAAAGTGGWWGDAVMGAAMRQAAVEAAARGAYDDRNVSEGDSG